MCGIAGLAATRVGPEEVSTVERMCSSLKHRGPDDTGTYHDAGVVLGHRRLSIVDLAGGHQPLSDESGNIWVTFNGEIYNYQELRRELLQRGHRLRTSSDTEVLVHLYEDEGMRMLERLNGMFAFALWDARRRSLFLVRDRLGIKPLYYSVQSDKLLFASELKALLVSPEVPRTLDREALTEYLALNYINEPRTAFTAVRKLSSGCYLEYAHGRAVEHRYWRAPAVLDAPGRPLEDVCEEIRALLVDAVRLQLRADVPVGVFASGGIDSTAIMWAASRLGISLEAFVCEFDHLKKDTAFARVAAQATGMRLRESLLSGAEAGQLLPRLIWHQDEPFADVAMVPCYLIAREAADHVKVILNGTGGDELFGGYPRYNVRALFPGSRAGGFPGSMVDACGGHPIAAKVGAVLDFRERYLRRLCIFPEWEAAAALGLSGGTRVRSQIAALFREAEQLDESGAMMFVDLHSYLPGDLFMLLDKTTMAASLEARVPLLDHRLVEAAARLPGRLRMRGGETKWLLRHALRRHVPDAILDREKQGFGPPVLEWMKGTLGSVAGGLLRSRSARVRELLDGRWVDQQLRRGGADSTKGARQVWTLLMLELWLRIFLENEDPDTIQLTDVVGAGAA